MFLCGGFFKHKNTRTSSKKKKKKTMQKKKQNKKGGSCSNTRAGIVVEQQTKKACVLETNGRHFYDLIFNLSYFFNEKNQIIVDREARDYGSFTTMLKTDFDRRLHISRLLYENMDEAVDAYCRTLGNSPALRKSVSELNAFKRFNSGQ